jgi:hypothetical protein
MFRAVPLPIIRSSFTVHLTLVYVIQVLRQLSSRAISALLESCICWFYYKEICYDAQSHERKIVVIFSEASEASFNNIGLWLLRAAETSLLFSYSRDNVLCNVLLSWSLH